MFFAFSLVLLAIGIINIAEWISILVCSARGKGKEMDRLELIANTVAKCSSIISVVSLILVSIGIYMVYSFVMSGDTIHLLAEKLVSLLGMSKISAYTYGMWGGILSISITTLIVVLLWIKASKKSCDAS